jgi:uncharacterized membrane protein
MVDRNTPLIDMTPDGRFIEPPKPTLGTIMLRLAMFGLFLCIGALVFWTMLFMLPVLILLGVVGYFAARSQMRRFR